MNPTDIWSSKQLSTQDNCHSSGPWFCCFLCTRSEESWAGGIWRTTDRWESAKHRYFHIKVFAKHYKNKKLYNHVSQILTECVQWEGTAHAAFISHHPPQTLRRWETIWLKSRRCLLSYGKSSVGNQLWYLTSKHCAIIMLVSKNLLVVQHTQALCGCCFWWHTVRGTPTLSFWPSTYGKASAKTSLTAWAFRICWTGQTRPCWAICSGSTQVRLLKTLNVF